MFTAYSPTQKVNFLKFLCINTCAHLRILTRGHDPVCSVEINYDSYTNTVRLHLSRPY